MKTYFHLILPISWKQISQTTVHHTNIKRLIITYHLKRSLYITLMPLYLHIMLMFSLMTLCSYKMITHFIHVSHMKWLSITVTIFKVTSLIIMMSILTQALLKTPVIRLITSNIFYKMSLSFLNHLFMTTQLSKQPYFGLTSHQKSFVSILKVQ